MRHWATLPSLPRSTSRFHQVAVLNVLGVAELGRYFRGDQAHARPGCETSPTARSGDHGISYSGWHVGEGSRAADGLDSPGYLATRMLRMLLVRTPSIRTWCA